MKRRHDRRPGIGWEWPEVTIIAVAAVAVLVLMFGLPQCAIAETYETPNATCAVTWDINALWVDCEYNRPDLVAPLDARIWSRTSIEAYAGAEPQPWKWFCDLEGRRREQPASMVYPSEAVVCTSDRIATIQTGLDWTALGIEPAAGVVVPFGLKVNTRTAEGNQPAWKTPDTLDNDPASFGAFTLTESNRRGSSAETPGTPVVDDIRMVVTWDPQDDAEWFWLYVKRDDQALERVRVEGANEYPLDDIIRAGAAYYVFEVSAEAESLNESERSDSYSSWILMAEREAECPPPNECPDPEPCPDCPPDVVCPPVVECPECPASLVPRIQEVIVSCGAAE